MIWPHGLESAQEFCYHINSLMPTFKITMEIENDSTNPLSGELVIREGTTTNTKIYRKPIHTGPYLHFQSSRPPHVKRGIVKTIPRHIPRATGPVRRDCYFKTLNYSSVPIALGFCYQQTQEKCSSEGGAVTRFYICTLHKRCLLEVQTYSEQIQFNTVFQLRHAIRNPLMRTRPISDPQKTAKCIYSFPCECGRNDIMETGRPWNVRLWKHRRNLEVGHLERSRLAQQSFEENRRVLWE